MRWPKALAMLGLLVAGAYLAWVQVQELRWRSRFDSGREALSENRLAEARTDLEAAVRLARSFGGRDPNLARSLIAVGYVDIAGAKDQDAERRFREAIELLEQRGLAATLDSADALNGLSIAAGHRARDADARASLERALAIQRGILGTEHPIVARTLANLAWLSANEGRNREAERLSRQALAIREKALAPASLDVARNLSDLGWFLLRQSRYDPARPLFERARAILERGGDPASLDLARCSNAQGVLEIVVAGDAVPDLTRAMLIRERLLGPDHPDVAEVVSNLATAWREQGDYAKARPFYDRAVRIFEKVAGPKSPGLGWTLNNLGRLALEEGKDVEAESLFRRALRIVESTFVPTHPQVALSLSGLAEVHFKRGRDVEAEVLARRSLGILEGNDQPVAQARCLDLLGRIATRRGTFAEAQALFKKSLDILYKALPYPHPEYFRVCGHVAELFRKSGREAQARGIESSIHFISRCGTVKPKGPLPIDWSN